MEPLAPDRPKGRNLTSLRPAFGYLRPYWRQVAGASLALMVTAGATLSVGQGIRIVIDQGLAAGTEAVLIQSISLFAVLVVVLALGTFVRFFLVSWVGERISADIRRDVFDHLLTLDAAFFERTASSEVQARLTTDTTLLQTVIGSSVSIALRNILMFLGGLVLMVVSNPKLSALVLVAVPLVVLPLIIFGRKVRSLSRASQDSLAGVGAYASEALRHIKTVQAFTHEAEDRRRFSLHVEDAFRVAVHRIRQRAVLITLVMILVLAAIASMLWVGGQDVIAGRTSGGELAAFIFYAFIVAGSVGAISEVLTDLQRAAGATERLMELLASEPSVAPPDNPVPLPVPARGALELADVHFVYPARPDVPVLRGVDVCVEPGTTVALVGPSGAGKTTVFDLLLRHYDVTGGALRMDGVDVRDLAPQDLRAHIGVVSQEPVLFTGSIAENIRFGRPEADDAAVRAAADAAHALTFIDALPEGLDTHVGEGGVRLSGGQRQRVAIARAILKDPPLLLLDEATSALDAESEQAVQAAMAAVARDRTTLVIAHRLATVRDADRILVLDGGRIVGAGTHAELLESNPLYARLARLQFDRTVDAGVEEEECDPGHTADVADPDSPDRLRLQRGGA